MMIAIRELIKYRELVYMITWRDIHVKYIQSVMGFMWAILMPALIIVTGVLVRLGMAKFSGSPMNLSDVLTVSVKAVPWAFLISSIRFSTNSLVNNSNLITKIYFPREIFPISAVLSQLFDFMIASCVLIVLLIFAGTGWSMYLLWVIPLLLTLVIFLMALGLLLSAANLFFRDVKYLVEVATSFAIFFTPVFYNADLAGKWQWLLFLNPVTSILEGLNSSIVLHQPPRIEWVMYSMVVTVLGVYFSMSLFKKLEPKFAENS